MTAGFGREAFGWVQQQQAQVKLFPKRREQWDEAKWEGLEKDDEGRVKLTAIIALAEDAKKAEVKAEADSASTSDDNSDMMKWLS